MKILLLFKTKLKPFKFKRLIKACKLTFLRQKMVKVSTFKKLKVSKFKLKMQPWKQSVKQRLIIWSIHLLKVNPKLVIRTNLRVKKLKALMTLNLKNSLKKVTPKSKKVKRKFRSPKTNEKILKIRGLKTSKVLGLCISIGSNKKSKFLRKFQFKKTLPTVNM